MVNVTWFKRCVYIILWCLRCGLRGGYVEIIGLDDDVHYQLNKLQSANLGSNVTGQLVMECVVNPPKSGQPSHDLYMKVCHSSKYLNHDHELFEVFQTKSFFSSNDALCDEEYFFCCSGKSWRVVVIESTCKTRAWSSERHRRNYVQRSDGCDVCLSSNTITSKSYRKSESMKIILNFYNSKNLCWHAVLETTLLNGDVWNDISYVYLVYNFAIKCPQKI